MKINRIIIAFFIVILTGSLATAQDADTPNYANTMPVTFEARDEGAYEFFDFGPDLADGEDPRTTVVADPDDASNMVARTNRPANAATWSGVTFMIGTGSTLRGLNDGSELKMSVRVRAPAANIPVLLKAESALGTPDQPIRQVLAYTTKADEWEILTFDFADPSATTNFDPDFDPFLDKLVIFFNFGASNAPLQTYYFDDVKFGAPEFLNLPFDFESDTLEYSFTNFEGGVATLIDNPQSNDDNSSAKVGRMVKDGGQAWAGTTVATDGPIKFGIHTWIAMDVYSPAAGKTVKFKLEPSGGEAEVDVVTTVANGWETLLFDFTGKLTKEFTNFSLFFGFGEVGDGSAAHTYLFDNIRAAPAAVVHPGLPLTFEDDALSYNFNNFGGGVAERIANPDMSGINTSGFVARMTKNAPEVWAGADILIGEDLDFSESSVFKMKVWSPRVGVPVLLKLEKGEEPPNTQFIELNATTTVANTWEELSYDFTGMTPADGSLDGLNKLVLIFENGTAGDGSANWTFYFDDVLQEGTGSALTQVALPIQFGPGVNYDFVAFGNMGETTVVDDPVAGASNPVARAVRLATAETWAGTTIGGTAGDTKGFATAIPFTSSATQLSMRVYAPAAGIPVMLKVEDKTNTGIFVQTEVNTSVANAWETLVFDFTAPTDGNLNFSNTYDLLSVFFNFGTAGATAGEQTFYYDDILFTGMTSGGNGGLDTIDLPVDFTGTTTDFTLIDFGGAVTILGADPTDATNVVAATQKGAGAETWAGTTIGTPTGFATPIPFTATDTQVSVRVYSPAVGMPLMLKAEQLDRGGNIGVEVIVNTTVANAWETLVFDFANEVKDSAFSEPLDATKSFHKLSLFFNFGVTGNDGGDLIFYWDDVTFVSGTSSGKLINISTRTEVGTADEVMIAGFIIREGAQQVLIQVVGPELTNAGLTGVLADPVLTLLDATQTVLMTNDDWEDSQGQLVRDLWGGNPPMAAGSASSALVIDLEAGSYTARVEGKNATTGIALVEVYEID